MNNQKYKTVNYKGILQSINKKDGPIKSGYVGVPDYYTYHVTIELENESSDKRDFHIHLPDNDKELSYKEGDKIYFRAFDDGKIVKKSLGIAIDIPQNEKIDDILKKLDK